MASNIDDQLTTETTGVDAGKIRISKLRTSLAAAKTEITALQAGLADKADTSALAGKADAAATTTGLAGKADATATTNALAAKADAAATTTALAGKADAAATTTALASKAGTATNNTYTKAQRGQIFALAAVANVVTPDFSEDNFFSFTPTASFTLANPTNLPAAGVSQSGSIFITQDATGGRVATFGNAYIWTGGTVGVLSTAANARDRIDYVVGPTGLVHLSLAKDVK